MKLRIIAISACVLACSLCSAQSENFRLGKWTEIHSALLKELTKSYVDSLPLDKIERLGVDAMLAGLDPYTVYIPEEEHEDLQMMINKSYGGIGAVIYKPELQGNVIINEPYKNSPAEKYGLHCGDEILAIDGKSVHGLNSQECSDRMKGEPGSRVVFKVKKVYSGEIVDIEVTRERIRIPDLAYAGMLDATTGYILQTGFTEGIGDDVRKAVLKLKKQGMQKLVLDLRGNGGGLMEEAAEIVSIFVPKGSLVVSSKGREPSSSYSLHTRKEPVDTRMPLIVLVDSGSASASEIVSGSLQDMDRATIMGTKTYGKGLVQSIRSLPYGGELKVTTAKYYTPSGRCVQAYDYSRRNEDGSVGHIPDSLTSEFRTAHGRIVRDGGGITPDVIIKDKEYSRITYALAAYGILEQYAMEYVRRHESIPPVEEFRLSDEEYEDFVEYAKGRDFDYRSTAKAYFDRMKEELEKDGLADGLGSQLDSLARSIEIEKEDFLRLKKDEITPFLEEEIVVRYYFQEAGVKLRLRYDEVLKKALESPLIDIR